VETESGNEEVFRRVETTSFTHWGVIISFSLSISEGKCGMIEKFMSLCYELQNKEESSGQMERERSRLLVKNFLDEVVIKGRAK
jgi:hypothetical protein